MVLAARDQIADGKRFPTGGTSNTEHFYRSGLLEEWENIETCVTFSWIQLNLRLFELTGDERALDLAEEAAWNQLLPALSPCGDTWSYHLSMMGPKRFFKSWVQGVLKENSGNGGAPISCCHTNGQRGLALVPRYAYTVTSDGALAANFYGLAVARAVWQTGLPDVGRVEIEQMSDFPESGHVLLKVTPEGDGEYELRLRRPYWSAAMAVDGAETSARRVSVRRRGPAQIAIDLDLRPQVTFCGFQERGKCAVTFGPLVMALDGAPNGAALDQVALDLGRGDPVSALSAEHVDGWPCVTAPVMLVPAQAVFARPLGQASVRLLPVLLAGLKGNPGLDQVIDGEETGTLNLSQRPTTLFPEYRVLLPYFWSPGS
jgi:DUF1680 family protein